MFIYVHPPDNVAAMGTAVPSTEDVAYPIANIYDNNPAKPFRFDDVEGTIVWDFGAAQRIDLVSLIHHNLIFGLEVRVQMNATDSWATPSLDELILIPANELDGYPVNPWLDLTDKDGYLLAGYRFLRLVFEDNGVNIALGEVVLGAIKRSLTIDMDWPIDDGVERPIVEHQTDYLVSTIYDFGVKQRTVRGTTKSTDAGRLAIRAWWDSCRGKLTPTLIVPFPEDNEAFFVRWESEARSDRREFFDYSVIDLAWREVSRGLVL